MASSTAATWDKLPDALKLRIFNDVPVDMRLHCSLVCRDWRTLLGMTEAWTRLDLSVLPRKTRSVASNKAIFRGFTAKGAGNIVSLDFIGIYDVTFQTLLEVVRANAATLETLRTPTCVMHKIEDESSDLTPADQVGALLGAALKMTLYAAVGCDAADAPQLNAEGAFHRLRVKSLNLVDSAAVTLEVMLAGQNMWLAADAGIRAAPMPMHECIQPLADALAQSRTLTSLSCETALIRDCPSALATILAALTKHPSLSTLMLMLSSNSLIDDYGNDSPLQALCALVAANSPVLRTLYIYGEEEEMPYFHSDSVLAQLLDALASNTHLCNLDLGELLQISADVAANKLLPAVHAATALRDLNLQADEHGAPALAQVQAILQAHRNAGTSKKKKKA